MVLYETTSKESTTAPPIIYQKFIFITERDPPGRNPGDTIKPYPMKK
jgi:hypothetical protein